MGSRGRDLERGGCFGQQRETPFCERVFVGLGAVRFHNEHCSRETLSNTTCGDQEEV